MAGIFDESVASLFVMKMVDLLFPQWKIEPSGSVPTVCVASKCGFTQLSDLESRRSADELTNGNPVAPEWLRNTENLVSKNSKNDARDWR